MHQEIKNNLTPTQNKPSSCFNCLHQLAGMALFFKELYRRRLRLSLCRFAVLLSPFDSHMWRQLSGVSMPLDYPTNQQSFRNSWEDESACWSSSRVYWCLLSYTCLPERLRAENRVLLLLSPAGTGTGRGSRALLRCHCRPRCFCFVSLSISRFLLWTERRWEYNFLQQTEKRRWDLHVGIEREQMHSHGLSDYMCMYANTSMFKHKNTPRHKGTLPHAPCRCRLELEPRLPYTPTSAVLQSIWALWSVSMRSALPRNLPHGPDMDKMKFVVVFARKADQTEDR